MSMNPLISLVEETISCAEQILSREPGQDEAYVSLSERYLSLVESIGGADSTKLTDAERELFSQRGRTLFELHTRVISQAEAEKASVRDELLGVRKKMQGLRAYLDRLPSRVTVAGKREG